MKSERLQKALEKHLEDCVTCQENGASAGCEKGQALHQQLT